MVDFASFIHPAIRQSSPVETLAVEDAGWQVRDGEPLNFDLVKRPVLIARLDVDHAELVVAKFALVVGIENLHRDDRGRQFAGEDGIEKMHQQPTVASVPSRALNTQSILGLIGCFIRKVQGPAPLQTKRLRSRRTRQPRMLCLAHRAWLNAWLGFPNQARRDGEDALIQAQRVDHPHSRVFALVYQAILGLYLNDLSLLRVGAMQVIDRANAHGFGQWLIFAHFFEGWAWTHDGQVEAGMTRMQNSLAEHRATCARWGESLFLTLLADAHGCAGQIDSALALVDEALAIARKTGEGFYLAEAYRLKGELLWRESSPQPEAAEACWQQALTIARNQGARAWEWRAVSRLAEAWRERERGLTGLHDGPRRYASASRMIPTTISGSDSNCPMVSQPKAR